MPKIVGAQRAGTEGERKGYVDEDDGKMAAHGEVENDGGKVAREGEQAEAGDTQWKGRYQIVDKKGVPGKEVFELRDEREWKILRQTVVKEGKVVVVWDVSALLLSLSRLAESVSANANEPHRPGCSRRCKRAKPGSQLRKKKSWWTSTTSATWIDLL